MGILELNGLWISLDKSRFLSLIRIGESCQEWSKNFAHGGCRGS